MEQSAHNDVVHAESILTYLKENWIQEIFYDYHAEIQGNRSRSDVIN